MNSDGLVKVYCKYQNNDGTCDDMLINRFKDCADDDQMECERSGDKREISNVTWTYYLINKEHLEIIEDEERT